MPNKKIPHYHQPKSRKIPRTKLNVQDVFDGEDMPRLEVIRNHMKAEGRLSETCALKVINSREH